MAYTMIFNSEYWHFFSDDIPQVIRTEIELLDS
jgi:hypothetical protein